MHTRHARLLTTVDPVCERQSNAFRRFMETFINDGVGIFSTVFVF
jgi:hypothetical protein